MTDRPPIFAALGFDDALARAREEKRLLLVDVTATWCAPCKHMDATTWRDPEVGKWVSGHAIAIQLDVDADAHARSLGGQAVPTLVLFRDGAELDRVVGARPPKALLEWLESAASGRTELDRLRDTPREDLHGRLTLASTLAQQGRDDEATEEFAWLWQHALEVSESWVGVRSSFLIAALKPVVERHAPARERFGKFCDALAGSLQERRSFSDWVTLNGLLGEEQRTLDWLASATPEWAASVEIHRTHRVLALLEERGEWRLLGRLLGEPVALLKELHQMEQSTLKDAPAWVSREMLEQTRASFQKSTRKRVAAFIRALRAVGRTEDAERTAAEAAAIDPSAEMTDTIRKARTS